MANTIHENENRYRREGEPVVMDGTHARQGYAGRPVLVVLIAGLVLAMIVWAFVEFYGNAIEPATSDAITPSSSVTEQSGGTSQQNQDDAPIVEPSKPAGDTSTPKL